MIESDLNRRLAEFGVLHFVHVQALDTTRRPSGALMAGPSNPEWRELYSKQKWARQDDLMKSGLRRLAPTTWRSFGKEKALSDGQRMILDHAHEFGFRDGYFLPVHMLDGSVACVSLFSEVELPEAGAAAHALHLLSLYYSFSVRRALETAAQAVTVSLTPRQHECLQWVRAGKTDWEIGQIIGISEHTVIEHLDQARRRLGVRTRTQAVIEAVSRGLIHI
jgi:DNA-binding CsgD family transcriptional regulator